jgi:GT2 family glycosyltransferase
LPELYNLALRESVASPAILIFVHDDVHLCDFFWPFHLLNGLSHFDIIGVAGNRRRVPAQPSWAFVDANMRWDSPVNLSGMVGHGTAFPPANLSRYGLPCQEVKLLDGLLLACRSETLLSRKIAFDERFSFHFYDLDFCRQAEEAGLRMGTWFLSLIHESGGSFGSPAWRNGYDKYLEKWGS